MNTEVATTTNTGLTKFNNFGNLEEMYSYGEKMIKSGFTPLEKPEDVVVAITTGLALGVDPAIAIQQIYPVNGRSTIGVHIITGLLLKAGIIYEVLEDYVPLYKYKDKSGVVYEQEEFDNGNFQIVTPKTPVIAYDKQKHQVMKVTADRRTTIKFSRMLKQPDGSFAMFTITETYLLSQTSDDQFKKPAWINTPKQMCFVACMRFGSRKVADDLMQGMMETSEMLDGTDTKYNADDEGKITILNNDGKEVREVPIQEANVVED